MAHYMHAITPEEILEATQTLLDGGITLKIPRAMMDAYVKQQYEEALTDAIAESWYIDEQ